MDDSIILTLDENAVYYVRYVPSDTTNYNIIENIEVTVSVLNAPELITPNFVLTNKTYDGTNNLEFTNISISNLSNNEYTIINAYLDNTDIGDAYAYITIRLSDGKFLNNYLEGEVQQKEYQVPIIILPVLGSSA